MLELLRAEHGIALAADETRRNLVTKGVSLNELVGQIVQVGSVRMNGVRLAEPCEHLERLTQAGILGVGAMKDRLVPVMGGIATEPMMTITRSCDHRVLDGARAASFLHDVVEALQDPWSSLRT
jgi:pyruvate/2-oxoglutarate dehydrogenase complex dihydrolipoamide acyltransferase (E2) component